MVWIDTVLDADYADLRCFFCLATDYTDCTDLIGRGCVLNAAFAPNTIRAQGHRFVHRAGKLPRLTGIRPKTLN